MKMQLCLTSLLSLSYALVAAAWSESHVAKGDLRGSRPLHTEDSESFLEEDSSVSDMDSDDSHLRPNAGGLPDIVQFGIFCKHVFGIDMKEGTFTADAVLTFRWADPRNAQLVPAGLQSVTLPPHVARKKIWLPDVGISNRALKGIDVISTAFIIEKSGLVTKVERVLGVIKNKFFVRAFPFDKQVLKLRVASSTLMLDELQLVPLNGSHYFGVNEGVFAGSDFIFQKTNQTEVQEEDGTLRKSRGELSIYVDRMSDTYVGALLMPEALIMIISYSAFWFPLTAPFAMPRVATALIAFLSLMTLSLRTNAMLPVRGGLSWMDLFESNAQSLMFCSAVLNILALSGHHSFEAHDTARLINHELKVAFPVLAAITFAVIFNRTDGSGLEWMATITQFVHVLFAAVYVPFCLYRLRAEVAHDDAQKALQQK